MLLNTSMLYFYNISFLSYTVNQLTMKSFSGRAHLGREIVLVFLSNNGGRLQNVAMALK